MKTIFYTKKGDQGSSTIGKKTYSKEHSVFELLGTLDECNSIIGVARAFVPSDGVNSQQEKLSSYLVKLQHFLFIAQAEVAASSFFTEDKKKTTPPKIKMYHITDIEAIIADIDSQMPELNNFVLPGGTKQASLLDYARTIARRTERIAVKHSRQEKISEEILMFLNRLSSILFALARYSNYINAQTEEVPQYNS